MTTQDIKTLCEIHIAAKNKSYRSGIYLAYAIKELGLPQKKAEEYASKIQWIHPPKGYQKYRTVAEIRRFNQWYYANYIGHYFENGFQSWSDVHHYITTYINSFQQSDTESVAAQTYQQKGMDGLKELAYQWTNEFEYRNRSANWELTDYATTILHFCEEKNFKK